MRTVYLRDLYPGDIRGLRNKVDTDSHPYELRNSDGSSVYFIDPKLRMRVFGVTITDMDCTRQDRLFGKHFSKALNKGRLPK